VNKWPKKEEGKIQFKELAHVELTFESETDTEVNWKVVKMTKSPEKDVSDDEFKHFDIMIFKKAVYNLSDIKVKSAEWGFEAYSGEKMIQIRLRMLNELITMVLLSLLLKNC
jgi:hypothetical protein